MIPWLVFGYFLISGIGIIVCPKEHDLRAVALIAHLLLSIAFLGACSEGLGEGPAEFLRGTLLFGVFTVLCFSPWLAIWYALLFMRSEGTPPV